MTEPSRKNRHPPRHRNASTNSLQLVISLGCGYACIALALHHPIAPYAAMALTCLATGAFFVWPSIWIFVLAALLPVLSFAPWTGWITAEEIDILVLSIAAGGYARLAIPWRHTSIPESGGPRSGGHSALPWLLSAAFVVLIAVAALRGITDAGGLQLGWFQGYHEPMNSIRLAKSFLEALILTPLWCSLLARYSDVPSKLLLHGMMLGLVCAALASIWERAAFTGLLDFTSDYRTTALFWEMHVGGAALDGFLALTVPFALAAWMAARSTTQWSLCTSALFLAAYACLTTFSRGVYVAIPLGVLVCGGLYIWQHRRLPVVGMSVQYTSALQRTGVTKPKASSSVTALLLITGFCTTATFMFQGSGYRGLAALLACAMLLMPLPGALRGLKASQYTIAIVLYAIFFPAGAVLAWLVPKGVYLTWAIAFAFTSGLLVWLRIHSSESSLLGKTLAMVGFLGMLAGTATIARHWGGSSGLWHAMPGLLLIAAAGIWALRTRQVPLWPDDLRWQTGVASAMVVGSFVISIFAGGAYMGGRFSTGERDFEDRLSHWNIGREMLRSPIDWVLGKGIGRFPASYFTSGNPIEHPGDYRLGREAGNNFLILTSGLHVNGWGELFRVTQRIAAPNGPVVFSARSRTTGDIALSIEVCEKHLIYSRNCSTKESVIKGQPGSWQSIRVPLPENSVSRGSWYAPRLIAFSMAVAWKGGHIDLDDISLASSDGHELLSNGSFDDEMARWFFSSDKHHLPWHAKNLPLHILIEQGALGLLLWTLLVAGALWRTTMGEARGHALSPPIAASLIGFVVVGGFDSLLDIPRLAMLFYFLLLVAWTLPTSRTWQGGSTSKRLRAVTAMAAVVMCASTAMLPSDAEANTLRQQVLRVGPNETIRTIAQAPVSPAMATRSK